MQETAPSPATDAPPESLPKVGEKDIQPEQEAEQAPVEAEEESVESEEAPSEEESEEPSEEEEAPAPWNPEDYKDHPEFQSWFEETTKAARKKGMVEGQKREAGRREQVRQRLDSLNNAIAEVNDTLREAARDGTLDKQTFAETFKRYAPQWAEFGSLTEETRSGLVSESEKATVLRAMDYIAKVEESPDLFEKYGERFADEYDLDGGNEAFMDFWKSAKKKIESRAEERGYKRGLKERGEVSTATEKLKSRNGKGPDLGSGKPGGISSEADADRAYNRGEISHAQYKEYRQRFGMPDRATYGR